MHVSDGSSAAVIEVPAHALPDLIAAHEHALLQLAPMLATLESGGRVPEPWTQDPVARDSTARFNDYAVDGPNSAYSYLRRYEAEVRRVVATLKAMHANYTAAEDDVAARMGSL